MIKEAIQFLTQLGKAEIVSIGEQKYATNTLHKIKEPTASALVVRNLSGMIDYLKTDYDKRPPVLVQVASPTEVNVYSTFNRDMERDHLLQASALLPSIVFERFMDVESFNVLLQSCFVQNDHRDQILSIVGNVTEETVQTVGDNGISQQVTAKAGIARVDNVVLPNPVTLKPFRTFIEIAQPECQFVFRMQSGPKAALFEADGGAWKLQAIHSIKEHLSKELSEEIAASKVTIIG